MKLGLSEVQQREICRVMLQCTGNVRFGNTIESIMGFLGNTRSLFF